MEIYLEYYRFDAIFVQSSAQFIYDHAKKLYNNELSQLGDKKKYGISQKYAVVV